jgi:hypothetical protein
MRNLMQTYSLTGTDTDTDTDTRIHTHIHVAGIITIAPLLRPGGSLTASREFHRNSIELDQYLVEKGPR